jgi:hypothetical protein
MMGMIEFVAPAQRVASPYGAVRFPGEESASEKSAPWQREKLERNSILNRHSDHARMQI